MVWNYDNIIRKICRERHGYSLASKAKTSMNQLKIQAEKLTLFAHHNG